MGGINIDELIGDPRIVDDGLESFRQTAMLLSSRYPRLIERFPDQWIALHSGRISAHGDSLDAVLQEIDAKGLSRDQTIVRFIQKDSQTLIL